MSGEWWRSAPIRTKILAVVIPPLCLGYLVAGAVFLRSERSAIISIEHAKAETMAASVVRSVQTFMAAGHAEIAQEWLAGLRDLPGMEGFAILRSDGEEAFKDNKTIIEVNQRLGVGIFELKSTQSKPLKVLAEEKLDAVAAGGGALHETDGDNLSHIFTIPNQPRCYRCHGSSSRTRGYLFMSTPLAPVKEAIAKSRLRLVVLLAMITGAVLFGLVLFVDRLIVRPIRTVAAAMAGPVGDRPARSIPVESSDEIGIMAERFNEMARAVEESHQRLRCWGERQEQLVEEKAQALRAKERELIEVEKLAVLGEMAGSVAHEINTPVSILISRADALLLMGEKIGLPKATREHLLALRAQGERIAKAAASLLNFARRSSYEKSVEDLNEVVRESLDFLGGYMRKAGLEVEFDPAPSPVRILANRNQIEQVLFNLLRNAQDASPEGGRVRVAVLVNKAAPGWVEVRVEDEGKGIAAEDRERIFEAFFTTKPRGRGAGLGLAVAKSIVKDHGGSIWAENRPGKGAVLRVRLPIVDESHAQA